MSRGKEKPANRTLYQVRSRWNDDRGRAWSWLSTPFADRAEAWETYHHVVGERGPWESAGGTKVVSPRHQFVAEIVEYQTAVTGERVVERSDVDPADLGRLRTIDVASLLNAARGRSGDAATTEELPACVECGKPSTSFTPGGLAVCDDHRSGS